MSIPLESRPTTALKEFNTGLAAALFFLIEFLPVGILFGAMALDTGLSPLSTIGISTLVFAGASQFLALTLISTGATTGAIILGTFTINLRHVLMSSYIASAITKQSVLHRIITGALVTDEGFALTSQRITSSTSKTSGWYVLGVNVSLYLQWQFSTLAGIYMGNVIPGMKDMGIEAALYALFISIVVLSVSRATDVLLALIAAAIAVCLSVTGYNSWAVLVASLISSLLGLGVYKWAKKPGS